MTSQGTQTASTYPQGPKLRWQKGHIRRQKLGRDPARRSQSCGDCNLAQQAEARERNPREHMEAFGEGTWL